MVKKTTTFFVQLTVFVEGGCADSITRNTIVNELPMYEGIGISYTGSSYQCYPVDENSNKVNQSGCVNRWIQIHKGGIAGSKADNSPVLAIPENDLQPYDTIILKARIDITGCEKELRLIIPGSGKINNVNQEPWLGIFPNPSNGLFQVVSRRAVKEAAITDLSGKLVSRMRLAIGSNELDLHHLKPGIYFLSVPGEAKWKLIIKTVY